MRIPLPGVQSLVLCCLLGLSATAAAAAQDVDGDARAIREVLERSYVRGVFIDRDEALVRDGFHAGFVMPVADGDRVFVAPLDMWLERLGLDSQPTSDAVEPVFEEIDITGGAATVKMQIWINGELTYTDYFALYRVGGEWKIVTKIFAAHG